MLRRELIVSLTVVVAAFVLGIIGIFWLRWSLNEVAGKVEQAHIDQARRSGLLGSSAELRQDEARADELLRVFERLVPNEDNLINLQTFLKVLAQRHNVGLDFNFQGGPTAPKGDQPGQQGFSISLRGELDNIMSFVEDLETRHTSFLFTINSMSFSQAGEEYQAQFTVTTYFKRT